MLALHPPLWLYVLFAWSAVMLLAGTAAASIVVHLGQRLSVKGHLVIGTLITVGMLGCTLSARVIWLLGGFE